MVHRRSELILTDPRHIAGGKKNYSLIILCLLLLLLLLKSLSFNCSSETKRKRCLLIATFPLSQWFTLFRISVGFLSRFTKKSCWAWYNLISIKQRALKREAFIGGVSQNIIDYRWDWDIHGFESCLGMINSWKDQSTSSKHISS